jgi:hypothetical protein
MGREHVFQIITALLLFTLELYLAWTFFNIGIILKNTLTHMDRKSFFYKQYDGVSGIIWISSYRVVIFLLFLFIAYILYMKLTRHL